MCMHVYTCICILYIVPLMLQSGGRRVSPECGGRRVGPQSVVVGESVQSVVVGGRRVSPECGGRRVGPQSVVVGESVHRVWW